jgi:hypothetical protein
MPSKKYKTTCVNLDESSRENLRWLCKRHHYLSQSAMVRYLLQQARESGEEDTKDRDEVSPLLHVA